MDNSQGNAGSSKLDLFISRAESLAPQERLLEYREFAKHLLVRHLSKKEQMAKPISAEECIPFMDGRATENTDGICFLFEVRGRVHHVMLPRKSDSKRSLMDLKLPAKVDDRTQDICELLLDFK